MSTCICLDQPTQCQGRRKGKACRKGRRKGNKRGRGREEEEEEEEEDEDDDDDDDLVIVANNEEQEGGGVGGEEGMEGGMSSRAWTGGSEHDRGLLRWHDGGGRGNMEGDALGSQGATGEGTPGAQAKDGTGTPGQENGRGPLARKVRSAGKTGTS